MNKRFKLIIWIDKRLINNAIVSIVINGVQKKVFAEANDPIIPLLLTFRSCKLLQKELKQTEHN